MTTKQTPLEIFATTLGGNIVKEAEEILNRNGLTETMFLVGVTTNLGSFKIQISCNEFIYEVPELSIFDTFIGDTWYEQIQEFAKSYGKFMAWNYLRYCNIEVANEQD